MATSDTLDLCQAVIDKHYPGGRLPRYPVLRARIGEFYAMSTLRIPVVADPSMPPGYFEMRSGSQRVGVWISDASNHDPGDEDRSER